MHSNGLIDGNSVRAIAAGGCGGSFRGVTVMKIKLSTAFVAVSVVLTVAAARADPQLFGRL
jgi:hypothetical protein